MELVGVLMVAYEQDVADKGIEAVAQVGVGLVGLAGEGSLNLALGVVLLLHAVAAVVRRLEIRLAHHGGTLAEHALEHPVGDEGLGEQLFLEVQTVGLYLLARHAERRRELSEQSVYGVEGYLPYPEEAQHVVDAVGVEEPCHVGETAYPPLAAVFHHLVPVVGRQAPVLSVH